MNNLEQISTIALGLAVVALFNWLTGDRSFRGSELMIRQGAFWVRCRWFGMGVWLATVVATSQDDFLLESAGLIGAFILLFGTARKTIRHGTRPGKETTGPQTKTDGDQVVSGNRRKRPS